MRINPLDPVEHIATRICELQKSYVSLQEQLKNSQNIIERKADESALRVIDILDMLDIAKLNMDLNCQSNSGEQLIIKKIEKRLGDLLRHWQVQEITFTEGRIEPGKARVIETRKVVGENPAGVVIEVCRKGYQRGNKIIRPADVITAESKK